MKKQIRKAMICTIAMMLVAIVTLTGVTYAWFTESDTSVVEGLNVGVVAVDGGVYISQMANPSYWSYRVPFKDVNLLEVHPVSTAPSTIADDGALDFFTGHLDDEKPDLLYTEKSAAGNYVKKDLYIKNDELDALYIQLNPEYTTVTANKNIECAMRLAIVDHGAYEITGEGEKDHTADSVKTTDSKKVYIYEFDAYGHVQGADNLSNSYYGVKKDCGDSWDPVEQKNVYPQEDCFSRKDEATRLANGETSEYLEQITSYYEESLFSFTVAAATQMKYGEDTPDDSEDDRVEIIPAYHKITLYIWLEGQDVDCTNSISGSQMSIQLGFQRAA